MDHLQKNEGRIQKFKAAGNSPYIYQIELDKACFQRDIAYGDSKYLTASDKTLGDKAW